MYRKEPQIVPPWGGWMDNMPSIILKPSSFKQIINWMIDKGRLRTFPFVLPFDSDTVHHPMTGLRTFLDGVGRYHTLGLGSDNSVCYYDPSQSAGARWVPQTRFQVISGFANDISFTNPGRAGILPFAMETYANKVFFTNGQNHLCYVDGGANWWRIPDLPGSCFFLGKLANKLIMVNVTNPPPEAGASPINYPSRIKWSATLNPFVWDPLVDFTAGQIDLFEIEDSLTGWATLGFAGYAFRTSGIIVLTPTGVLGSPFRVESFSMGPKGIGCNIPYTCASYGNFCCFVALDDIYQLYPATPPMPIGGNAKRSIYKDIVSASSPVVGTMLGSLYSGNTFLSYWLLCPQLNDTFTSAWAYHFDDQTWVNLQLPGAVRSLENVAIL